MCALSCALLPRITNPLLPRSCPVLPPQPPSPLQPLPYPSRLDQIFMVMEFMDHDLKSLMNDKSQMTRSFSVAEVKCLMLQLLSGIDYLHQNWVIHR